MINLQMQVLIMAIIMISIKSFRFKMIKSIKIRLILIRKLNYTGIHTAGFKDFLLKPELLRALQDCGFEHPSEGIYLNL
jgi:hypothetical protein